MVSFLHWDEVMTRSLLSNPDPLRIAMGVVRALLWCVGTLWKGVSAVRAIWFVLSRLPLIRSQVLPCPRRHSVPVYGVFECSCGAIHEGWAFDLCRVCGQTAGWTPCRECGLPVRNPVL